MTCSCFLFFFFACDVVGNSLACFCAECKPLLGACKDSERLERRGWGAGGMTILGASNGLSCRGGPCPAITFLHSASVCSVASFARRPPFVPSGVDGDDFAATTSDQQDALQPFCQDLEELHVW